MTTDGFAMFVHVTAVITGLMLAAVLHTALVMTRRARTVAECRPWVPVIGRVEPLLPLAALVILVSGSWLLDLSGGEFRWGDDWVVASLVTLVAIEVAGGLVAPRSKAWRRKIAQAADGPVPADVRSAGLDPALWCVAHAGTAGFLGIVLLMSAKPTVAWSVVIPIAAVSLGAVSALPFIRRPAVISLPEQRGSVQPGQQGVSPRRR